MKFKHGLHRPGRCCIKCYRSMEQQYPVVSAPEVAYKVATYAAMDETPQPYTGHAVVRPAAARGNQEGVPDRGAIRTLNARRQTAENAGDRW